MRWCHVSNGTTAPADQRYSLHARERHALRPAAALQDDHQLPCYHVAMLLMQYWTVPVQNICSSPSQQAESSCLHHSTLQGEQGELDEIKLQFEAKTLGFRSFDVHLKDENACCPETCDRRYSCAASCTSHVKDFKTDHLRTRVHLTSAHSLPEIKP